jgi:hypothetical protein
MSLAAELQWQLLPPLTFSTPRVVIAGLLEPAYEVAGDAFDYALNGHTAHLAVLDLVGHDLTTSAVTIGSYRHSRRTGLDLAATHGAMDRAVAAQFGGERFVTGQLALLDCATDRLQWVNAGHLPTPIVELVDRMVLADPAARPTIAEAHTILIGIRTPTTTIAVLAGPPARPGPVPLPGSGAEACAQPLAELRRRLRARPDRRLVGKLLERQKEPAPMSTLGAAPSARP